MKTLEEITYDAGRHALAEQDAMVAGIRQRTGTLLAAHALVASFLGAAAIRAHGLDVWGWIALVALAGALIIAAVLLAPWKLVFAVDARNLYERFSQHANDEADVATSQWLAEVGIGFQQLRDLNAPKVRRMSALSATLSVLMVVQTLAWIVGFVG